MDNKKNNLISLKSLIFRSNKSTKDFNPKRGALNISSLYLFAGILWIVFSDKIFLDNIMTSHMVFTISTFKGGLYVLTTAIILYYLIKAALLKIQSTNKKLMKQAEQLKKIAFKDSLTGLPNRVAFYEDTKEYFNTTSNYQSALIIIDIDKLKYINDTLGHSFGDKVIINTGKRLMDLIDENKSVYKIGGDEFIVFARQYEDIEEIEDFADKILKSISVPYNLPDGIINITATIGIALYPINAIDVDALLKCADLAIYKAKLNTRGGYTLFSEDISAQIQERVTLQNELRGALEHNEFSLHYQPQINIETGEIDTIEALLRWNNRKLGPVSPLKFISIAEETNLINSIGDWVFLNACSFVKRLHEQGYPNISISVNISIIQLLQPNFIEKVMEIISQVDIDPKFIELEITESVLIESYDEIKDKLIQLKSKGFRIALDDFGNGYSSLSYLTHIPVNTLKIDKNFIDTITCENDERTLTSMIIMIGCRLGLTIVAEGVETECQMMYLRKHKCHKMQGYYFSKPIPPEDIIALLNSRKGMQIESEVEN